MMTTVPKFETTFHLLEHSAGLNVVKISPDGSKLLSGGMDGTLILWDLYNGQSLQKWTLAASNGITAAAWCSVHKDQPTDAFIIGTSAGSVAAYRKVQLNYDYVNSTQAFIGPVEDIAFDNHHNRLAIVGDGRLKLYNCTETHTLGLLHETVPRNDIARNACFYANGSSVFVTYLESQHLTGYTISPWAVQFDGDIDTRIGHAALREGGDLFVTNLMNGMDVYSFPPTPIPRRNFRFPIDRNFPLVVATSSLADFVVIGGEDGTARLYDSHMGLLAGTLSHGNRESLVQHVDLHVSLGVPLIATACADETDGSIKIWEPIGSTRKQQPSNPVVKDASRKWVFQAFVAVLVTALYYFIIMLSRQLSLPARNLVSQGLQANKWIGEQIQYIIVQMLK